jgi:energy-coupling factor transporter ATP-binding protein EcfA2
MRDRNASLWKQSPALLEAVGRLKAHAAEIDPGHETGPDRPLSAMLNDIVYLAARIEDRLQAGPDAPAVVAVLGATGTGKSKIFNTLTGQITSPSGFRRPTTMAPVVWTRPDNEPFVLRPAFLPGYNRQAASPPVRFDPDADSPVLTAVIDPDAPAGLVLIDTPDFDSVLAANRRAAADVFHRADAVIFVTDAVKYADQASWDYLDRIRRTDKASILIVNRLRNELSLEDFTLRLKRTGLDRPLYGLFDQPGLADDALPTGDPPALAEAQKRLDHWSGPERAELLVHEAVAAARRLSQDLHGRLNPWLSELDQSHHRLAESWQAVFDRARADLDDELTVAISGELKTSLIGQIQALFVRVDLMRYPRKIIGAPYRLIKDKVLTPMGWAKSRPAANLSREVDRLFEANAEGLVLILGEANRRAAALLRAETRLSGLSDAPGWDELAHEPDRVREEYGRVRADLEAWVGEQARELVQGLNLGEKMTFYLAQVISLSLFISIQVHTGGGFSFLDGLLDSVLAPFLSKITGQALSRDKVRAFEEQAQQRHLDGCRALIQSQADDYLDFLNRAREGLAPADDLKGATRDFDRALERAS